VGNQCVFRWLEMTGPSGSCISLMGGPIRLRVVDYGQIYHHRVVR
jgi:hypothetical protein